MIKSNLVLWMTAIFLAASNNYVGNQYIAPRFGNNISRACKTVVSVLVILMLAWLYFTQNSGYAWFSFLLIISCLWVGLAGIFELIFGHYLLGDSWDEVLTTWQNWLTRIWLVILLVAAILPLILSWFN